MKRNISSFPNISTFCQVPYEADIDKLESGSIVILGIPWDEGVGFIPGQRLAPKQIRDYSARFRLTKNGFFTFEENKKFLQNLKIFDIGDIGVFKTLPSKTFDNITESINELVRKKVFPIILGGDHSITYPVVKGFNKYKKLGIIQLDAHLDFNLGRENIILGNENCLRRISELPFISSIVQIGIRGLLPDEEPFISAKEKGNIIISADKLKREKAVVNILKKIAELDQKDFYLTLDIDVLDPSIASGTSTREPNGLSYEEVKQLLQGVTEVCNIVGVDIVEVNPLIDPSGLTAIVATRLILDFLFKKFGNKHIENKIKEV